MKWVLNKIQKVCKSLWMNILYNIWNELKKARAKREAGEERRFLQVDAKSRIEL